MKELGYKDLKRATNKENYDATVQSLSEMTIRYQSNLPSELPETDEQLEKVVREINNSTSFCDVAITEIFPNIRDLESTYVLTQNFFEFLTRTQEIEHSSLNNDFINYIFDGDAPYGNIESVLTNMEAFLRRLAMLLGKHENCKRIQSLTLVNLIELERYIKNEPPLIDDKIPHFRELATTLRIYRNKKIHEDSSLKYYISQISRDKEAKRVRELIRDSVSCLVMMLIWSHFDEIYAIIGESTLLNNDFGELREYLKSLKKSQLKKLNDIYGIQKIDNEIGFDSITEISLKAFSHINDNIEEESHILLAGESGTGKSTLLASMVYRDIKRWEENPNSPLPIKIEMSEMKDFESEYKCSFFSYIVGQVKKTLDFNNDKKTDYIKSDYIHNYLRQLFKDGKIVLYVDGLNELPLILGEYRGKAIEGLIKISNDYDNCRFVVTSRIKDMGLDEQDGEGVYGTLVKGGTIGLFKRYDLQPFTKEQIDKQIENYLRAKHGVMDDKEQKKIAGYINKSKIEELAKNPLQLILILDYFDKNKGSNSLVVTNRSQLLFKLTKEITKSNKIKNDTLDKMKDVNKEIRKILLKMAEFQYKARDNQGLTVKKIEELYQEVLDPSIAKKWTVKRMLEIVETFGILKKDNDLYDFRHDSWREHFLAYNIVMLFQTSNDPVLILQDIYHATNHFKDREALELFRHIFEIAEMVFFVEKRNTIRNILEEDEIYKENIRKEIEAAERDEEYQAYINDKARFIDEYGYSDPKKMMQLTAKENKIKRLREDYEKNAPEIEKQKEAYLCSTEDQRKLLEMLAHTLLQYDNGLKILSYATATMASFDLDNTDTSIVPPKTIVEQTVVNRMNSYKAKHPEGDQSINNLNQELKPIFECTALSGNGKLLGDLIGDLYWLNIWLNLWTGSETLKSMENVLTGVLMAKCENQLALFYSMFDAYKKVNQLAMIKTANKVELIMMRLITLMNDGDVIEIITDFLSKNYQDPIDKIQKTRIGPKLLLGLKDIDLMFKILNEREELQNYRFETTIHLRTLDNLLRYFSDQRMQQFLIGSQEKEGLISTLRQGDEDHLLLLNYTFHRIGVLKDEYKEYFFQYLRGKKGQAVIARHHELLDLLPLDEAKTLYNYQLTDYDADDKLFRTQTVNYTLFSKDVAAGRFIYTIAIPHPHHEDLASYDITLLAGDDAEKCELKAGQYTLEKQENNQKRILLVSCSSGEPMNIPAEGELQFVSNGQTATLAFDHLRDLICLNRPELYHASICERLRRECNDYQDFLDMFYFFREKSCLSMLLARFYVKIAEPSQKQIWDIGKIDYCAVTSKEAHMTRIFSPLKSKIQEMYVNGNFTTVDFRRGAVTTAYELENNTTYVLQEKNGSLWSSIDERIMTPDNLHLFGFIPGEVRCTNDGDKIVVPNLQFKVNNKEQPLFFDFDNSKLRIEEGTRVLFFPIVIVGKSDDTYKTNKIEIITDDTL